jgi:hypothetical protein
LDRFTNYAARGSGCSMLTRLPSVSKNATYLPTPGIGHWLAQHLAAGLAHLLHRVGDIIDGDHHRRKLRRPVRILLIEAAVDHPRILGQAAIHLGRGGDDVIAHLGAEHLQLPAERALVKLGDAVALLVGHFEVNDRAHLAHGLAPLVDISEITVVAA